MSTTKRSGVTITRVQAGIYKSSNGFTISLQRLDDGTNEWQIWETLRGPLYGYISAANYADARSQVCFQLPDATKGK